MIDEQLLKLAREIVKDLALETAGIWNITGADNSDDRLILRNRDGLQIHLGIDWKTRAKPFEDQRLNVSTWAWPSYTEYRDNKPFKQGLSPRDLYNPEESSPDITVAISRGSLAIARAIKARFLPDYKRIYERLQKVAAEREAFYASAHGAWLSVCGLLAEAGHPVDPARTSAYLDLDTDFGPLHLRLENRTGTIRLEADLNAEQLRRIVKALQRSVPSEARNK